MKTDLNGDPIKCAKHTYEFVENRRFVESKQTLRGTITKFSIRAVYVCKVCGHGIKRTPNPNAAMPQL